MSTSAQAVFMQAEVLIPSGSGPVRGRALALTKRLFVELDGRTFGEGIALGARTNALARTTPDFKAAIARFLAR